MAVHAPVTGVDGSGVEHLYEVVQPLASVFACHPAEQAAVGRGATGQDGDALQLRAMSERVRGPTIPYPVVVGVPDRTMPYLSCKR